MSSTNTKTITLKHPVQLPDRQLTEVTMRRMTVGDLMDCPIRDAGDFGGEIKLVARLTGLSVEDVRAIDAADYTDVQKTLLFFRTGEALV